jgi:hypothetical protein
VRSCSPPPETLNVWAIKIGSCSCAQFLLRTPFGAVDIVREIALLPRAPFYSTGCSICWSLNLRFPRAKLVTFLDTAPVTTTVGDALRASPAVSPTRPPAALIFIRTVLFGPTAPPAPRFRPDLGFHPSGEPRPSPAFRGALGDSGRNKNA